MSESPIPPDLLESIKEKFTIVKQAQSTGNLALLSAVRKSDNKPVAIVCSIQYEDEAHVKHVMVSRPRTRFVYLKDVFFADPRPGVSALLL